MRSCLPGIVLEIISGKLVQNKLAPEHLSTPKSFIHAPNLDDVFISVEFICMLIFRLVFDLSLRISRAKLVFVVFINFPLNMTAVPNFYIPGDTLTEAFGIKLNSSSSQKAYFRLSFRFVLKNIRIF